MTLSVREFPLSSKSSISHFTLLVSTFAIVALVVLPVYSQDKLDEISFQSPNLVVFPTAENLDIEDNVASIEFKLDTDTDWAFAVERLEDRTVLTASRSGQVLSQFLPKHDSSVRFGFDLKQRRFLPVSREIRIDLGDQVNLDAIENLSAVSLVKKYEPLGFAIVVLTQNSDPVEVKELLIRDFNAESAKLILKSLEARPL